MLTGYKYEKQARHMNREHHQDIYDFVPRSHSVERLVPH